MQHIVNSLYFLFFHMDIPFGSGQLICQIEEHSPRIVWIYKLRNQLELELSFSWEHHPDEYMNSAFLD